MCVCHICMYLSKCAAIACVCVCMNIYIRCVCVNMLSKCAVVCMYVYVSQSAVRIS